MVWDRTRHPCFSKEARHRYARVHLPVAPRCNIQCNYCNRKSDCVNESRPGVCSAVLTPGQAIHYLRQIVRRHPETSVVGIAGPGDPFAGPEATMETLRRVRKAYPEMLLCVATNGLAVKPYLKELAALQLSHLTITVNAVDPSVGAAVYAWARDGKRILRKEAAAERLWQRQREAIAAAHALGITIKVNTIVMPGVNDAHLPAVTREVAALGADMVNVMPVYPVAETPLADIAAPTPALMKQLRADAEQVLPIMTHCARCRADAAGLIGQDNADADDLTLQQTAALPAEPDEDRPYVAVASREGVLVNQHLGEARELWIYALGEDGRPYLKDNRIAPAPRTGQQRWRRLARTLRDCRAIACEAAGETPRAFLQSAGVRVVMTDGLVEEAVATIFAGALPPEAIRRAACSGTGQGCSSAFAV